MTYWEVSSNSFLQIIIYGFANNLKSKQQDLSKTVDFLLENAGDVIKYRLHKEILKDLSKTEEENLFEKVMQTTNFKLVKSYVKPNGYIGIGMHTGNNKELQLKEGEAAARLLSSYAWIW